MLRTAPLTLALVLILPSAPAAPTPKEVKAKSVLDRVKPVGIGGLIEQPAARASLKLAKEQEEKIGGIRKDVGAQVVKFTKEYQNNPAAAVGDTEAMQGMMDKLSEFAGAFDTRVVDVFTEDQMRRVKQLYLQREGPAALLSRYAVRELGLTAEQEDKMADELAPLLKPKVGDLLTATAMAPAHASFDKMIAQRAEKLDKTREAMLKHLTADQKKAWKEMVGEEVPTVELIKGAGETFIVKLMMEFAK